MIYLFFFLFTIIAARLMEPRVSGRVLCFILAMMLGVFAALRGPDVANDYAVYRDWYSGVGLDASLMERPLFFELFFFEFMKLCSRLGLPFTVFLGVVAVSSIFIKLLVIKKYSKNTNGFIVSLFLYCWTFYLLKDFTQIRAGLAISIVMFAASQLIIGQFNKFYLLILLASGFHMEALLAVPLPLLVLERSQKTNYILVGITLLFLFSRVTGHGLLQPIALLISSWDPKLSYYTSIAFSDSATQANFFSFSVVILLIIALNILFAKINTMHVEDQTMALTPLARCILVSLWPLFLIPEMQEIALRAHEFLAVNTLLVAAILFSRGGFLATKVLLLAWGVLNIYINIFRAGSLVRPYSIY